MNIRKANKFDLPYFIHVAKKVQDMDFVHDDAVLIDKHFNVLFNTILHGGGIALVAESEQQVGIVVGVINENIWMPNLFQLTQILFYVDEEWRSTKAGHRLLTEYNNASQELLDKERVNMCVIHASEPLHDINFDKFGYKMVEKVWQLEQ
jgi:hypothetical protein